MRILGDDGVPLPTGQTGRSFGNELLSEGYSGGDTKETVDGLTATGDVGHLDDEGLLFVDGRVDGMIVSVGALPRSEQGKVLERDLAAEASR